MGLNCLRWNSLKKYFIACLCTAGLIYEIQRWKFGINNNKEDHFGKIIDNNLKKIDTDDQTDDILKRKFRILAEFVDPRWHNRCHFKAKLNNAYKNLDVIQTRQRSIGHHLENSCKYPVLAVEDPSIREHIIHNRTWTCKQVEPDLVVFDQKTGLLKFDRRTASDKYGEILASKISCQFRPFAGSLRPDITTIQHYGQWTYFHTVENGVKVYNDQFEVTCFVNEAKSTVNPIRILYRNAFAQVSFKTVENQKLANSGDNLLSLDIVGLDSTSLNMFKRHMPRSWSFMIEKMGFLHFEGYNKVADNSMVNWVPIFLGKRYLNQSESENMMDELVQWPDAVLELDQFDWLWKFYKAKRCATMMNDDPMHFTRGLFHYPWTETFGFRVKPTDYYFRPWHVFHRRWPHKDVGQFCFHNRPYFQQQLDLVERMIERFAEKCHFSFSFFTDLTHDFPHNVELMDDTLAEFLNRTFSSGYLNNTVLLLMGDHGNRISTIQYTYVGRIEERATFFSVYFPQWFRDKYPHLIQNLQINKYRLTSNYDVHRMLKDIIDGKFDGKNDVESPDQKGISLFSPIPPNRQCSQAHIPENHCLCMINSNTSTIYSYSKKMTERIKSTILRYTKKKLHKDLRRHCSNVLRNLYIKNVTTLTTNQMIQHGVRYPTSEYLDRLKTFLVGEIEYYDVVYGVSENWADFSASIRLQYDRQRQLLTVSVPPLLLTNSCSMWREPSVFCACASIANFDRLD